MRFGAIGLAAFLPALAGAEACDRLPPPSVTVKRLSERVTLNVEQGHRSLAVLGAQLARPGSQVLGLTRGNAVVKFASKTPTLIDGSGQWECASPQLTLSYGYSPLTIYVASEFPPGTCAYKAIYEHELRHVNAYLEHLVAIEKDLTETLNRRFATGTPWRGAVGDTRARLQREFEERWAPYVKRELGRVEATQALIDTPEEYARVAASCHGEIRNRLQ